MLFRSVDPQVVLELLLAWNRARCRPPLSDQEVASVVSSITKLHESLEKAVQKGKLAAAELPAVKARIRTETVLAKAVSDAESFDQVLEVRDSRVRRTDGAPEGLEPAPAPEQAPEAETRSELQRDMGLLAKLPLFSGLSPALLKLLAFTSEHRAFAAGDVLFRQGDPTDGAHVVLSGELDVVHVGDDGREALLGHISPKIGRAHV